MHLFDCTKIPTLIDIIEHDVSLRIIIYIVKVNKIGYQLTHSKIALT